MEKEPFWAADQREAEREKTGKKSTQSLPNVDNNIQIEFLEKHVDFFMTDASGLRVQFREKQKLNYWSCGIVTLSNTSSCCHMSRNFSRPL